MGLGSPPRAPCPRTGNSIASRSPSIRVRVRADIATRHPIRVRVRVSDRVSVRGGLCPNHRLVRCDKRV